MYVTGFIRRGFCFQFLADSANKWWQTFYFATAHNEKPLKSNDSINWKFNRWQKRIRNTTEKDKKKKRHQSYISEAFFVVRARAFKCFLFIWSICDGFFMVSIFFKVNIAYLFVKHHVCANQIAKTEIYIENRTIEKKLKHKSQGNQSDEKSKKSVQYSEESHQPVCTSSHFQFEYFRFMRASSGKRNSNLISGIYAIKREKKNHIHFGQPKSQNVCCIFILSSLNNCKQCVQKQDWWLLKKKICEFFVPHL